MKILGQPVISKTRSGNYQYAIVEGVSLGIVTVRLGSDGTGARLTNLNIVGTAVVGDLVVVDYSSSVPYVRTIQQPEIAIEPLSPAAIPLELPTKRKDVLDPCALVSGEACGMIATIHSPTTFGVPYYIPSSGGCSVGLGYADAVDISTAKVVAMGIGGNLVLLDGFINYDAWSFTETGEYIFLGVGGGLTQTKPTLTDECVVVLGIAMSDDLIRFKPELVIVELL